MIDPTWKRIAGVHVENDGTIGAVWLAHDTITSVVHLYDCALFRNEVPVVIEDAIAARGRRYPVAWAKKDKSFADVFLNAGIRMLPDPCEETSAMRELISRRVWQMMRASRFRVEQRLGEWLREYKEFFRDGSSVPEHGFPLMASTRHAIEMMSYARPEAPVVNTPEQNYPKLAIV